MTVCHLAHSLLPILMATGEPRVSPCRTPPRNSTSSRSKDIRAPRPKPSRRRASAVARSSLVTATPAGSPSTVATSAGPCDSPAVSQRIMVPIVVFPSQRLVAGTMIWDAHPTPTKTPRHMAGPYAMNALRFLPRSSATRAIRPPTAKVAMRPACR